MPHRVMIRLQLPKGIEEIKRIESTEEIERIESTVEMERIEWKESHHVYQVISKGLKEL